MLDTSFTSNSYVSVKCDIVELQDELMKNVGYFIFIDKYESLEVTTKNSIKAKI